MPAAHAAANGVGLHIVCAAQKVKRNRCLPDRPIDGGQCCRMPAGSPWRRHASLETETVMDISPYMFVLLFFPSLGLFFVGIAALVWATAKLREAGK